MIYSRIYIERYLQLARIREIYNFALIMIQSSVVRLFSFSLIKKRYENLSGVSYRQRSEFLYCDSLPGSRVLYRRRIGRATRGPALSSPLKSKYTP